MSDDQNFPPPPSPMPSPNPSPNPTPSPSPMPAPSPGPEQSFGQFAPPTMPAGGATPPPTYTAPQPTGGGGGGKKNGLILGIVAAVVAVGVAAFILLSGKDDDKTANNSPSISLPDSGDMDNSSDDTQAPDDNGSGSGDSGSGSGGYAVGEMADVDGGVMRVNSVETNSGFIDQYSPPSDGTSYTRVEVEACAISDNVDSGYIEWEAFLDDGSVAELSYTNSEAPMLTLIPGDCARGYVVYVVPNGAELTSISHTDFWTDERFVWDLTAAPVAIDGPMPASGGTGNEIGSSFTFNSGVEATVVDAGNYESTDEYYELPDGRRLVAANVRVCSESTTTVFASDFYVFTDDNFVATVEYYNSSFVTTDLNPGDCAEGGVVFLIPEDSNPSMIMYKEFGTSEFARWMP